MAGSVNRQQIVQAQRKRTLTAAFIMLVMIPLTILLGFVYLDNRKYMLISFLILFETMAPFFMVFEHRKPRAREIVMLAMLSALAVVGNLLSFSMLPIQAGTALVIIAGISFGPEAGFLVGTLARLVSNFFQGQGTWTPWQMVAWGLLGFLAGLLFANADMPARKRKLPVNYATLTVFTFLAVLVVYGLIMNLCTYVTALGMPGSPGVSWEAILAVYATGIPFDVIHAFRAAFFMLLTGVPLVQKLERVKMKFGFYRY